VKKHDPKKCAVCTERTHRIPAAAIKALLAEHGITTINKGKRWAEQVGVVSTETVGQIVRGRRKHVGFDTADRIVTALDSPEIWYTRLKDYYYPPTDEPRAEHEDAWWDDVVAMFEDGGL
jgi:hypothetical protein